LAILTHGFAEATRRTTQQTLARWTDRGFAEEMVARSMARDLLEQRVDDGVSFLLSRPAVRASVARMSSSLVDEPSMWVLIDAILHHLIDQPDIRALVHEQSATMADEAIDEMRAQAQRADRSIDQFIRHFLRREGH
jgi:hypothetical protein